MDTSTISLSNLCKLFQGVPAVDNVTLEIKKGEIFGLLGPNGAGKSTLVKMLTTMLRPSGGTASVLGHDIIQEMDAVRSCIGVVFQDATLDGKLTGRENLDFHAQLYNIGRDMRSKRINEVLELVDLRDKEDMLVETYSGGMQRRLAIARGLINHPQVLFLDEPTLGLDAQTRRHIWEYIKELNAREGMTILLTTHYMEEAERLCKRVAIIDHGKIVAMDTPEALKNTVGADTIIMQVRNGGDFLLEALSSFSWVISSEAVDGQLVLQVDDAQSRIPQVIIEACMNRATVTSVSVVEPTLEDVFLRFTGRSMREGESFGDLMSKWQQRRKGS
ncbi:MAG: Trehalose/maltose import ATP-binding protein MalK [Methanosaeta sp. PtaU1.Bin112]|nr:MAG: Trehalose/maltose import ATP-binding protein MalK [Methanosaeta sp. PtaU1.Bin112]